MRNVHSVHNVHKSYKKCRLQYNECQQLDIIKNKNTYNKPIVIELVDMMIRWKLQMDQMIEDKNVFRHLATFTYNNCKNQTDNLISENSYRELRNGCNYGQHAEMAAIYKLPPLKRKAKKQIISLIVIRINKHGVLKNSKPCFMCIKYMEWLNRNTSYKIQNVYYSHDNGTIIMEKFSDLLDLTDKHVSRRFKNNGNINVCCNQ